MKPYSGAGIMTVKNSGELKAVYSAAWETHLRATGRHLPYGTQCYLPPDASEHAPS